MYEGYCRTNIYSLCLFGEISKPYCQKVAIQYTGINEQLCKVHHDIRYCHRKCKYLLMDVDIYQLYQIDSKCFRFLIKKKIAWANYVKS